MGGLVLAVVHLLLSCGVEEERGKCAFVMGALYYRVEEGNIMVLGVGWRFRIQCMNVSC